MDAHLRTVPVAVWLALGLSSARALAREGAGAAEPGGKEGAWEIFDGKPKAVIVNGYSTSFHWPKILQRKLDRHLRARRKSEE